MFVRVASGNRERPGVWIRLDSVQRVEEGRRPADGPLTLTLYESDRTTTICDETHGAGIVAVILDWLQSQNIVKTSPARTEPKKQTETE